MVKLRFSLSCMLAATAAAFILSSCNTAITPPGFDHVGTIHLQKSSEEASPETIYALMSWYEQTYAENRLPAQWKDFVNQRKLQAMKKIQDAWIAKLTQQSNRALNIAIDGTVQFDVKFLANCTNLADTIQQLKLSRRILNTPISVHVPSEQCLDDVFWKNTPTQATKDAFAVWAFQRNIEIPLPESVNAGKLTEKIDECLQALTLKLHVCDALSTIQQAVNDKRFTQAMNDLDSLKSEISGKSLQPIEDTTTFQRIDDALKTIPDTCVKSYAQEFIDDLTPLAKNASQPFDCNANSPVALDAALAKVENAMTHLFDLSQKDTRFAKAIEQNIELLRNILGTSSHIRTTLWKHAFATRCNSKHFWDAIGCFKSFRSLLTTPQHHQFSIYSAFTTASNSENTFARQIEDELTKTVSNALPDACNELLAIADKAINFSEKYGYAFGIACMTSEMLKSVPTTPELQGIDNRAIDIRNKSQNIIKSKILNCQVSVTDMTSPIPGLGLTYTKDVTHALRNMLPLYGMDQFILLNGTFPNPSKYSYALFDGILAEFDGKETIERRTTRNVKRFGEIVKSPNPELRNDASAPPVIYTQEVYEQYVNVREIERLAHIRAFANLRGPGFSTRVEVNEFYSRQFIIEESHPFSDVRVKEVIKTHDPTQLHAQDPLPKLQYDRVWTSGEMLDWARKDSIRIMAMKILFHLQQLPVFLESNARHFADEKDFDKATELWATCAILMNHLALDNNTIDSFPISTRPSAKCYEKCLADFQKQREKLASLKKITEQELINVTNQFYKQALQP